MKKLILFSTLLFLASTILVAQTDRIPFLSNGKYGIVDEKGKIIIPTNFEDIVVHTENKIIAVLKNDLWAVYNMKGIRLLDHVIKDQKTYGTPGPIVRKVRSKLYLYGKGNPAPSTNLVVISDAYAKVDYFINPEAPIKHYEPYNQKNRSSKKRISGFGFHVPNNHIVTTRDNLFMAIDSLGKEKLTIPVEDAFIINNEVIGVGKDGLFAIYNNKKRLTEHIYSDILSLTKGELFCGILKTPTEKSSSKKEYHLFDKYGKIFTKSENSFSSTKNSVIIKNQNGESTLYDSSLKKVKSFGNNEIKLAGYGKLYSVISTGSIINNKTRARSKGLYDINGNMLLDTIYTKIKVDNKYVLCSIDNMHSVLDSNLNKLIECDTVKSLTPSSAEGMFHYSVAGPTYKDLFGLMDINQKPIIKADNHSIRTYECIDFALVVTDSSSSLVRISDNKIIASTKNRSKISVDCVKRKISVPTDTSYITLDFLGNVIKERMNNRSKTKSTIKSKYKIKEIGKMYALTNSDGNLVDNNRYKKIEIITDPKTKKTAYFCVYAENQHPSCKVLNDDLKEITPAGYSIAERWVRKMKYNKGTIYVANDADVAISKYKFKSGIVDFDGNWLVKPFTGRFNFIDDGVYLVSDYDSKRNIFYNAQGNKVNTLDYDIISKMNGSDYFQNRIPVGILQDRSYIKKLEDVIKTFDTDHPSSDDKEKDFKKIKEGLETTLQKLEENNRKIKAIGEPDILYGYVNKLGKQIIPLKYISATCFGMSEPYATVSEKDKNGNISTHIIDTLDNKIVSVPYESLSNLQNGYYSCKSNGFYGIVDSIGNAKTDFIYNTIRSSRDDKKIYTASDSTSNYIIGKRFKTIRLEPSDGIEVKKINAKYFYAKLSFKVADTYKSTHKFHIYSYDLELIEKFDDINEISEKFNTKKLPIEYLSITKSDKTKVVYNLKEKKLLEDK